MDPEIEKIIQERTRALPEAVKRVIARINVQKHLWDIAKEEGLRIDQSAALETEAVLVLLGIQPPELFVAELSKSADISEEVARRISTKVNDKIFKAVRSALAEDHSTMAPSSPSPVPEAVTRPPESAVGTNIANAKLAGTVRTPSDAVKITEPAPSTNPTPASAPTPQRPPSPVEEEGYSTGTDPYREPLA